jgi:hypothetical protein
MDLTIHWVLQGYLQIRIILVCKMYLKSFRAMLMWYKLLHLAYPPVLQIMMTENREFVKNKLDHVPKLLLQV